MKVAGEMKKNLSYFRPEFTHCLTLLNYKTVKKLATLQICAVLDLFVTVGYFRSSKKEIIKLLKSFFINLKFSFVGFFINVLFF